MSCGNFKNYARNKMFIGIFYNGRDDEEIEKSEMLEEMEGDNFVSFYNKTRDEIFGELSNFVSLDNGYYEGASIGINYARLITMFDYDGNGAKKRKNFRINLEKKLQKLFKALKEEFSCFDILGMGFEAQFDNGETMYKEYEEGKEEI